MVGPREAVERVARVVEMPSLHRGAHGDDRTYQRRHAGSHQDAEVQHDRDIGIEVEAEDRQCDKGRHADRADDGQRGQRGDPRHDVDVGSHLALHGCDPHLVARGRQRAWPAGRDETIAQIAK